MAINVPVISAKVEDVNETTKALTGDPSKLIKFYSHAEATMEAYTQNGAVIDKDLYIIRNSGETGFGKTYTFYNVESNVFHFSAADSLGFAGKKIVTTNMVNYTKLTCDIAHNRPDALGSMTVSCSGNFFNDTFGAVVNTITVQYRYGLSGGTFSDWYDMNVTTYNDAYYAYADFTIPDFDQNLFYSFETRAIDKLMTVSSTPSTVNTIPLFHWSEKDFVFEVPVKFNGGIDGDIVIEQGESGGWTYRKWSSGWCECWKTFHTTVTASDWTTWGTLYTAPLITSASLPFTFVSNKREFATIHGNANGFLIGTAWFMSQTTTGEYNVCSPTKYSGSYGYLTDIYVVGMVE